MRLIPVVLLALLALAAPARAQLPSCDAARAGTLVVDEVIDTAQRPGSGALYATHRLELRLGLDGEAVDPDGTSYAPDINTLALTGPGVVGPFEWIGDTPGAQAVPAAWTVFRSVPFEPQEPFCAASGAVPITLRAPKPTRFSARPLTNGYDVRQERLKVLVALGAAEDLSPVDVSIRRGARGRRIALGTIHLADAGTGARDPARPYSFKRRAAGVRITAGPRDARFDTKGVVTIGVFLPKVRDGRVKRRDFTLELGRGGATLYRVRAAFRCRGLGSPPPLQICEKRKFRAGR
jgi:hypothetical protein